LGNDPLQPSIATKILRFHVLANSDSPADQKVKEKVRDAVGTYLKPLLEESNNIEETRNIVNDHMDKIVVISKETLKAHGYDYEVKAVITHTDFPEKTYGSYTFPKGNYEALEITIGKGDGQNWWCVLYPNMCFKGTVFSVEDKGAGEELKEVLSPLEYADVFDSGEVEVRLKALEYFFK
jgi:stage II sporulation protein R